MNTAYHLHHLTQDVSLLGMTVNHLMYADDVTLIAPSTKGLQSLLHICENDAIKHEIIFT